MFSPDPSDYCNVHQSIVEFLRMVGLKPEPYYMSESDGPLRDRLKSLYKPEILSKNCEKFRGNLACNQSPSHAPWVRNL